MERSSYSLDGRHVVVATKHSKETILGPLFQQVWGCTYAVAEGLDTDKFGTFTGEKERLGTPQEVVVLKAKAAVEVTGADLALATEGSFVSHPMLPGLVVHTEHIALIDMLQQYTFVEAVTSYETLGVTETFTKRDDVVEQMEHLFDFPNHGVVVRPETTKRSWLPRGHRFSYSIEKGIQSREILQQAFEKAQATAVRGAVVIEHDFRAMVHPTRQQIIRNAGMKLIETIRRPCPTCGAPGWQVTRTSGALPCDFCGAATRYPSHQIRQCRQCGFEEQHAFPAGTFDTSSCAVCNP